MKHLTFTLYIILCLLSPFFALAQKMPDEIIMNGEVLASHLSCSEDKPVPKCEIRRLYYNLLLKYDNSLHSCFITTKTKFCEPFGGE